MLMPIGILLAAAVVGIVATHQNRAHLATVEAEIIELCRLAANGLDLENELVVNDISLKTPTIAAMTYACAGALPDLSNVSIEVVPGEMETVSSHRGQWTTATHHATITVGGVTTLSLRVRIGKATMNQVIIVGYWIPGTGIDP